MGIPLLFTWKKLVDSQSEIGNTQKKITLSDNITNGTTVHGELLIHKEDDKLEIFSSRCTHLGCRINKFDAEGFICPCHGSRFSFNGKVIQGPAYKPLTKLNYTVNKKDKTIVVELNA